MPSPLPPPQLDLFADSRDVMLRNDLVDALLAHDAAACQRALAALAAEFPDDPDLTPGAVLASELPVWMSMTGPAPEGSPSARPAQGQAAASQAPCELPFADTPQAQAAQNDLLGRVQPAARQLLGQARAGQWLLPLWARLARRTAALAFDPACEALHAAPLWLRARQWQAAAQAAQGIESWRRKPAPLTWATHALWHLKGPDAVWPQLVELAWLAPSRVPSLVAAWPDPPMHRLWRRFEDEFEAAASDEAPDPRWWPAWVLVEQPRLAPVMDGAQAQLQRPPETAWQLLQALLRLERQGRQADIAEHRRRLRDLHPGLFAAYMRSR